MKCNYPLNNFKTPHPPLCGKPAVARVALGQHLADLIVCEEHKLKVSRHLPWQPLS